MKHNWVFMLAGLAAWAFPCAVWAAALPYESLAWETFPDRQWYLEEYDPAGMYPDWDPSALKFESYLEAEQDFSVLYGIATCQVYDPLLIAVVYYCTDGKVYIAHQPMQLVVGQSITLTWQLPAQDQGVSRLLLLAEMPRDEDWHALLLNPVEPAGPVSNIVAEQWLGRQSAKYQTLPWESISRFIQEPPTGFSYGDWPACRAWAESDLSIASKDCAVQSSCQINYNIDEFGPVGRWQLDWSGQLTLVYQLAGEAASDAILLILGRPKTDFTGSGMPDLEIEINNWRLTDEIEQTTLEEGLQQYYVNAGHYMQEGWNTIEVRVSATGGGILQVDSIDLWVR